MGKMSRDKGAAWEREVAKMLRAAGVPAKRGLGQARSASEVADVQVEGWWCELKCGGPAAYPMRALDQADAAERAEWITSERGDGFRRRPVAICKQDRRDPTATWFTQLGGIFVYVTVSLEDWIRIVAAEHRAREVHNTQEPTP